MSIVSGSPPAAPASMGGLSSAVEDLSVLPEMNSLRFDGSSYLRKNSPSSSMSTWTWSIWLKNSSLSGARRILRLGYSPYYYLSMNAEGATGDEGKVSNGGNAPTTVGFKTTQQFRDLSAWYHIVAVPTGVYINGNLIFSHASLSMPSGEWWSIGSNQANNNCYIDGYLANIHFIDGQALNADSFGEWISDIWKPRPYTGDYGVNGFHLDFAGENMVYDSNGKLTQVLDASSNDNHWTAH